MSTTETTVNESLFRKIYSDNYALILNLVNKHIGNFHDSEEICQNLFIVMYDKFHEIENHGRWLRGAVRFEVLEYFKKNNRKGESVSIDEYTDEPIQSRSETDSELAIILKEAINRAENYDNEQERVLFQLIAINKYSYAEAASEMGTTRRQAEYAYGKVIQRVFTHLKSKGISPEAFE